MKIKEALKYWNSLTPTRKLSTLGFVIVVGLLYVSSIFYKNVERSNKESKDNWQVALSKCEQEKLDWRNRYDILQREYINFMQEQREVKLQNLDSLKK